MKADSTARIAPRGDSELDEQAAAFLAQAGPNADVELVRIMLWHPDLLEVFRPFGSVLLRGILPPRNVEMVILRVSWLCDSETEWAAHSRVCPARERGGLTDDDIERITVGPDAEGWGPFDVTVLRAVDELHEHSRVSDETWAALAEEYDNRQLIEFVLLVGNYTMLSYAMNSFGVEPGEGWPGFPPGRRS